MIIKLKDLDNKEVQECIINQIKYLMGRYDYKDINIFSLGFKVRDISDLR